MANKRQRANRQRREYRADDTQARGALDDDRRPLKGFESLYEITRKGDVYSLRQRGRRIKPALSPYGNWTYIRFTVNGKAHSLNIAKAIAESWADDVGPGLP